MSASEVKSLKNFIKFLREAGVSQFQTSEFNIQFFSACQQVAQLATIPQSVSLPQSPTDSSAAGDYMTDLVPSPLPPPSPMTPEELDQALFNLGNELV